mgnify:CR=1 FL=1
MEEKQVKLFYEEMKNTFVKPNSDWGDKAKTLRTLLEKFFQNLTPELDSQTTLWERMVAYYDANPDEDAMRSRVHRIRKKLNDIVHDELEIGPEDIKHIVVTKEDIRKIYEDFVLVVYNATKIIPDSATFELLGVNQSNYLKGLNEQQKNAVLTDSRIVFVNAGPGTGKTTLLVQKMVHYIIKNPKSNHIVALSFTNTAARQQEEKFQQQAFMYLKENQYELFNGTIHSFCLRKMRKYYQLKGRSFEYMIIGDDELFDFAPDICKLLNDKYTLEEITDFLSNSVKLWPADLSAAVADLKARYKYISLNGILTLFDDLLSKDKDFVDWILASSDLLVIDEAQDLNECNFTIFSRMLDLKPSLKLFMVGDPRQNIFEFNGGSYEHLDRFLAQYQNDVSRRDLSISYRCPEAVLSFVNKFTFMDCENVPLRSDIDGQVQLKEFPTVQDESESVVDAISAIGDFDSCSIISPNIKGLADIIEHLNVKRIPYVVLGGRRKIKSHIKFVNNLLRILYNNNEKSILSVCRVLAIDVKTQPIGAPRHFSPKELFFRNSYGRSLRDIYKEYDRLEWSLPRLIDAIVDKLLPAGMYAEPQVAEDFKKLRSLISGYKTIKEYLDAFSIDKERFICFYEKDFVESVAASDGPCLTLSTIHSAKGLEWKYVFLIGMYDRNFPGLKKYSNKTTDKHEKYLNTKKKELYVACTRTAQQLSISYPKVIESIEQTPSRLIAELEVN